MKKSTLYILALLSSSLFFVGCNENTATESSHKHAYEATMYATTCEEGGYTLYKCACGDAYRADEMPALGHEPAEQWTNDFAYHWHACTREGCNAHVDKAPHEFENGACTECGQAQVSVGLTYAVHE